MNCCFGLVVRGVLIDLVQRPAERNTACKIIYLKDVSMVLECDLRTQAIILRIWSRRDTHQSPAGLRLFVKH